MLNCFGNYSSNSKILKEESRPFFLLKILLRQINLRNKLQVIKNKNKTITLSTLYLLQSSLWKPFVNIISLKDDPFMLMLIWLELPIMHLLKLIYCKKGWKTILKFSLDLTSRFFKMCNFQHRKLLKTWHCE